MNKEARSFIWGLILFFTCGIGVAIHITQLRSGMNYTWYEWTLLVLCTYGFASGGIRVFKTID
jgi:hypothetical protein